MRTHGAIGGLLCAVALGLAVSAAAVAQEVSPERVASPVGPAIWCGEGAVAYTVEAWRGPRADTGTFVRTLATGATRRVNATMEGALACSPDGRFLVYRSPQEPTQTRLFDLARDVDTRLGTQVYGYRWAGNGREFAAWQRSGAKAAARLSPPSGIQGVLVSFDGAAELVWAANRLVVLRAASALWVADDARPTPGWQQHALPVQRAANLRADRAGNLYVAALASAESATLSLFRCAAEAPSTCAPLLADFGDAFGFDVTPDGSLVFLSDRERNCVAVLDVRSGRHACRLAGQWKVIGVSGDGRTLLVVDPGGLLAVAPITGALVPREVGR